MADKNEKGIREDRIDHLYKTGQCGTTTNEEMAGYNASVENVNGDRDFKNDRHNNNARSSAALESEYPRINTDNL